MASEAENATTPHFEARDLHFAHRAAQPILSGLSMSVDAGAFAALIGPNGAGKTTLLRLMTGLFQPDSGNISYRGKPLTGWFRRAFAREVAVVPQHEDVLFPYTVEETILMGRFAHQHALVGFDDEEDRAIAAGVLRLVDLEGFASRRMDALSGGERQRVLVARALAQCPSVLLLDEPTSSMDLHHQRQLFGLLETLNAEHGITVFVVTHDINLAAMYARRLLVLDGGTIVADGTPEVVLNEETLRRVYRVPITVLRTEDGMPVVSMRK